MGNIKDRPEEEIRARYRKLAKRAKAKSKRGPKSKSVRAVSGGLPSLGKRR